MSYNQNYDKAHTKTISVNNFIQKKIKSSFGQNKYGSNSNVNVDVDTDESECMELENLEKEFKLKTGTTQCPKNYGRLWTDDEREKILECLEKNNYTGDTDLFDEKVIGEISKELERTDYGIREEIKKMIFNDYVQGIDYETISDKFNIPLNVTKVILKFYIEKNSSKIIKQMENENKILQLYVENAKLKKELGELNKIIT